MAWCCSTVIASQRVARMRDSFVIASAAKQSIEPHKERRKKAGLLRCARNDVDIVLDTTSPSRREASEALIYFSPRRAWGTPDAHCTRSLVCALVVVVCTRVFTTSTPEQPTFPHA